MRIKMQKIEIHIKGQINKQWSDWFGGLSIRHAGPDESILSGCLPDQSALYGVLSRLRDLGLELVSVSSQKENEGELK